MRFQVPEGMQEYVSPTEFCDCDNVAIKQKSEELTRDVHSPKEAAMKIFSYVRDQTPFAIGRTDVRASETLKDREGYCVTKTNLQVALLRAAGIPARYHQVVLHKDVLKGIILDAVYEVMEERIWYHPWCECYLSGKWVACDSYLDKDTYDAAVKKGVLSREKMPSIDWDGDTDLKIAAPWMLEDVGIHSSYDAVCKKVVEETETPLDILIQAFSQSNQYTRKLRKEA